MNENMRKIVERLEKHASPTPSKWREVFELSLIHISEPTRPY